MARMGIRQLRDGLTAALRRVEAGETIEVTRDGEAVALLTPVPKGKFERLVAEGSVTLPKRPLDLGRPLLKPAPGTKTTTEIIEEDREDRF